MSGGAFDYKYAEILNFLDKLSSALKVKDDNVSEKTLGEIKKMIKPIKLAAELMKEIEWLYSGDNSEETFLKNLTNIKKRLIRGLYKLFGSYYFINKEK